MVATGLRPPVSSSVPAPPSPQRASVPVPERPASKATLHPAYRSRAATAAGDSMRVYLVTWSLALHSLAGFLFQSKILNKQFLTHAFVTLERACAPKPTRVTGWLGGSTLTDQQ